MKHFFEKHFGNYDRTVLWGNAVFVALLCIVAVLFTDGFSTFWSKANAAITDNFGWFYTLMNVGLMVVCFIVAFSKWGRIKLGKDNEKPQYSTFIWVAMLFSASIGVGVYFYGAAEPLMHYMQPPYLAEGQTPDAMAVGMAVSFFHWGFISQGIYLVVGLGIGIAAYRLNKPFSYSSALYGVLGEKAYGPVGKILNFLCVFCTLTGLATATGMAVLQLSWVIQDALGLQNAVVIQLALLAIIFAIYLISSCAGLDKGMARVSSFNTYLCFGVMIFVFVFGPTKFILNLFMDGMGTHIQYLPFMAFWSDAPKTSQGWLGWWSVFYRAWSFAWAPFVGGFMARISRGRTVRQMILGSFFLPALIMYIWYAVMGSTSIYYEINDIVPMWEAVSTQVESGFFTMLKGLPLSKVMSVVSFVNLITFVVTSADSGSLYVSMVCANGDANPRVGIKVFSAVLMAIIPAVLLIGGGLPAVQTMSVVSGFPIAIVSIFIVISIFKMVSAIYAKDYRLPDRRDASPLSE